MSVAAVDWALRRAPVGSDASARLVLVYLADRADDEGRDAYPSIATLVEQSHLSRSTIKRILKRLEDHGLISRGDQQKVAHYRVDRRPVVWNLRLDVTVDNSADERGFKMNPRGEVNDSAVSTRGQNEPSSELNDERGFTGERSGGSRVNHKPSNKPSINPLYPPEGDDDDVVVIVDDGFVDEPDEQILDAVREDDTPQDLNEDVDVDRFVELMDSLRTESRVELSPFKSETSRQRFDRRQREAASRLITAFGFERVSDVARWVFHSGSQFWKGVAFTPERLERNWTSITSQIATPQRFQGSSLVSSEVSHVHVHSRGCDHVQQVLGYTNPWDCFNDSRAKHVMDLLNAGRSIEKVREALGVRKATVIAR